MLPDPSQKLGLVSIQRNRAKYLLEWFAFHYVVGFRKFYYYAHMCDDGTHDILKFLQRKLDIQSFAIKDYPDQVQLMAYQHACDNFMNDVDWMAFIDGDEFMFSPAGPGLSEQLLQYQPLKISALAVYNLNFGSSGHIKDPDGLIIENFTRCAGVDHLMNRRVKSFVKGRQSVKTSLCGNYFLTELGTVDEALRPVDWGYLPQYEPTFERFRFNHYVCQSREFFDKFKRMSGHADAGSEALRDEAWWTGFDTNEYYDLNVLKHLPDVQKVIQWFYA